jgi:hypothetical protein
VKQKAEEELRPLYNKIDLEVKNVINKKIKEKLHQTLIKNVDLDKIVGK